MAMYLGVGSSSYSPREPLIEGNRALQNLQFALSSLPLLVNRCLDIPLCVASSEASLLNLKTTLESAPTPSFRVHRSLESDFCRNSREAFVSDSMWEAPIDVCLPKLVDPMTSLPRWSVQEAVVEIAELALMKASSDASIDQSETATHLAELTGYRFIEKWNHQEGFEHLRVLSVELLEGSQIFKIFVSSQNSIWDLSEEYRSMSVCGDDLRARVLGLSGANWIFGHFENEQRGHANGTLGMKAECVDSAGVVTRKELIGFWTVSFDLLDGFDTDNVGVVADFKQISPDSVP